MVKKKYRPINYEEDVHAAFEATMLRAIAVRGRKHTMADIGEEGLRLVNKQLDREQAHMEAGK